MNVGVPAFAVTRLLRNELIDLAFLVFNNLGEIK